MLLDRQIQDVRRQARSTDRRDAAAIQALQKRLVAVRTENARRQAVAETKGERDVCAARFREMDSLSGLLRSMRAG